MGHKQSWAPSAYDPVPLGFSLDISVHRVGIGQLSLDPTGYRVKIERANISTGRVWSWMNDTAEQVGFCLLNIQSEPSGYTGLVYLTIYLM